MTWTLEGDFERDGAVLRARRRVGRAPSPWPGRPSTPTSPTSRRGPSGPAPTTTARSSRTSATGSGCRRCGAFIEESGVAAIAAELMGSRTVRLYHDHVLVKEPGTRQRTPWHQDQPYYNVDGRQNASMWLPGRPGAAGVDAASSSPARTAASGSCPASFLDDEAKWFPDGSLTELPDIDGRPGRLPRSSAGSWSPATPCSSTCSRCTPPAACRARTADGCCRCASSATTPPTRRGRGRPRRRSPASPTSCRPAPRWTTRCSRCLLARLRVTVRDDRHRRPSGAAPAGARAHRRRAGVGTSPDAHRRPHRHDACRQRRRHRRQPGPRAGARSP